MNNQLAVNFVRFSLRLSPWGMNCRTILIQFIPCYVTSKPTRKKMFSSCKNQSFVRIFDCWSGSVNRFMIDFRWRIVSLVMNQRALLKSQSLLVSLTKEAVALLMVKRLEITIGSLWTILSLPIRYGNPGFLICLLISRFGEKSLLAWIQTFVFTGFAYYLIHKRFLLFKSFILCFFVIFQV